MSRRTSLLSRLSSALNRLAGMYDQVGSRGVHQAQANPRGPSPQGASLMPMFRMHRHALFGGEDDIGLGVGDPIESTENLRWLSQQVVPRLIGIWQGVRIEAGRTERLEE